MNPSTRTKLSFGLFALGAIVLAQTLSYKLNINGKAYSSTAIVVKGETYVPLKALQAAGVRSNLAAGTLTLTLPAAQAAGGANQVAALEGCLGEWLFNGIWRVRVTEPKSVTGDRTGATYRVEFRNGTSSSGFAPSGTGWNGMQLALDDGTTTNAINTNEIVDPPYLAGGSHTQTIEFFWENPARTPQKIVILFNPNDDSYKLGVVKFTVPDPSLRIKTTCQK
jgi:hypothetical protein